MCVCVCVCVCVCARARARAVNYTNCLRFHCNASSHVFMGQLLDQVSFYVYSRLHGVLAAVTANHG